MKCCAGEHQRIYPVWMCVMTVDNRGCSSQWESSKRSIDQAVHVECGCFGALTESENIGVCKCKRGSVCACWDGQSRDPKTMSHWWSFKGLRWREARGSSSSVLPAFSLCRWATRLLSLPCRQTEVLSSVCCSLTQHTAAAVAPSLPLSSLSSYLLPRPSLSCFLASHCCELKALHVNAHTEANAHKINK